MSLVTTQLLKRCRSTVVNLHTILSSNTKQHQKSDFHQVRHASHKECAKPLYAVIDPKNKGHTSHRSFHKESAKPLYAVVDPKNKGHTNHRSFHKECAKPQRSVTDPENKGHHSRGVNFDTIGSWNNRLDMEILYDQSVKRGIPIPRIPVEEIGIASVIGRRKVNEDRWVVKELSSTLLYFAMFDGHGGAFAADFVTAHLHEYVSIWLRKIPDLADVLKYAFRDINNVMTRHLVHYHLDTDMFNSGTTATVCLLRDSTELVVGHVGDSRAILCRSCNSMRLSCDDDPENLEESARIKENGGKLVTNSLGEPKVNGRLAMTRSLGDCEMKQFGVIANPHIKKIEIKHGKDAFLVLTTDGMSFVLSDQEVVDIIGSCENPMEAANFLTDQALHFGSEDNTTAMIIPFGAWGKYRGTTNTIQYSFGRNLSGNRFTHG